MTLEKKKNIKKELFDFLMLLIGCVCTSLSFNLFLLPNNIVVGFSGLSIVANSLFGIRPSLFLIISYSILAILSLKFLGFKSTRRTILGSILYPLFVELTTYVTPYIDLSNIEGIVLILCGAILSGFGSGLVYKVNYSTGGSDVVNQLLNKLLKQPIGKCMLITNGIIISIGFAVFGLRTVIYSILVVYIISSVTDRVMIGISESKTFRIITQNETDVKKFLLTKLSHGVTVIEARGGYTGDNIKMIMCIVPTREYITVKEGVLEIDNDAMIMVSDVYEVLGNK
ncbi:MAG: YitT family protein [Firmicutes bacterium]|nr:YitT family protein [Bacillota bacterium]